MRNRYTKGRAAIVAAVALVTVGVGGTVGATQIIDSAAPITGDALTEASRVALEHVGQGRVTDTEIEDEDSYYEVEVTSEDGRQIDVQLNEEFEVIGSELDKDDGTTDDD